MIDLICNEIVSKKVIIELSILYSQKMKYLRLIKNNSKNLTYLLIDKKFNCNVGKMELG